MQSNLNEGGNCVQTLLDYYPYGKVLREFHIDGSERYMTTQHERDQETQLDYRGARFYDGEVGRFLSLDPLATEYPSISDYVYVAGNPIMFIDPDGKKITFTSESDAKRVIADVNAIFKAKFDIDYDVLTYKKETIEDTFLGIFSMDRNVFTLVTNADWDWDWDEFTAAIYDVINAEEEVLAGLVNQNPEYGATGDDFVVASSNAVNYVDNPSTENFTVGGIFLHEVTYHKSPLGLEQYNEALEETKSIPLAKNTSNKFRREYGLKKSSPHAPQPFLNGSGAISPTNNMLVLTKEEQEKLDIARAKTGL